MSGATVAVLLVLRIAGAAAEEAPPYDLPPGATVTALVDGPDGTAVAFYSERMPTEMFCAAQIEADRDAYRRAVAFDADGRVLWRTHVGGLRLLWDAHVEDDVTVVLSGVVAGGASPTRGRFRVGPAGVKRLQ